ncbi:MAG: hypothetical protein J2P41_23255, partial [Blastocatellia bacterium]|nr:hypothetical protein [Blastocatellia bacterium]
FQFNPTYACDTVYGITGGTSVIDQIEGCLYSTGAFNNVVASCTSGFFTIHPYLLIEGDTAIDFAQASDLTGLITDTLKNCVTAISFVDAVNSVDTLQIDGIPQAFAGNPNYQQPTTGPGSLYQITQQTQNQSNAGASGCPPGTYDASVFGGLLGVNCKPGSPPSGFSWSALFGAGGSGVVIGIAAVVGLLFLAKR